MLENNESFTRAVAELESRIRQTVNNFLLERLEDQEEIGDVINLTISGFISSLRNMLYRISKGTPPARKDIEKVMNGILAAVQQHAFEIDVKITREDI